MLPRESNIIHQLRVQGAGFDPLLTRLRADHLLNMVDFTPLHLSPAAVLCIRKLHDPLPGRLCLDDTQAFPNRAWQNALQDELNGLVDTAARPLFGAVPANAQSVLFANHAELLACLALDWHSGQLVQRWWWRGLLRGDLPTAAIDMWHMSPEYVPAALAHLGHSAVVFVQALTLPQAQRIFEAVLTRYDLSALKTALENASSISRAGIEAAPLVVTPAPPRTAVPPWRVWLSESHAESLVPVHELLLGVALALAHQPAAARSVRFVEAAQRWLSEQVVVDVDQDAPRITPRLSDDLPIEIAPSSLPAQPEDKTPPTPLQPSAETGLARVSQWRYEADVEEDTPAPAQPVTGEIPDWPDAVHAPAPMPDAPELSNSLEPIHIITQFGGVFYLLNAALALGLYGDFTHALAHGLTLSPWDFLSLMGTEFIGADFEADPIWPLLARLSGRAENAPGHDFAAPEAWHVPPEWLEPFEGTALVWERADRLRVWHPAGFWLIDASEGNPPEHAVPGAVPVPQSGGRSRWCEWLAAYLRARLRVALDLEDENALVPTLFAHTAHIAVTPARVDITLNLTTLPIAIRYAGLDRDPGWIPAAGYAVAFRFEV